MGVDPHGLHTTHANAATDLDSAHDLSGATGILVAVLAAASASMFAAAVLSVFARLGWKELRDRRRRKQRKNAEPSACADSEVIEIDMPHLESETVAVVSIEGMTCSACSGAVERALSAVEGVLTAEVNLLNQSSNICFKSPATASALCEAIEDIGFGATLVSSAEQRQSAPEKQAQTECHTQKEALLAVEGMTCSACSGAVERALSAVAGVTKVEVNLLNQSARICFTQPVEAQTLCDVVEGIGFGATLQHCIAVDNEELAGNAAMVVLSIEGMTCAACSGAVERALLAQDGVQSADVNLLAQSAKILFESPATVEKLTEAVEDIGFGAVVASVEAKKGRTSAQRFANSLPNQANACLLRISFPNTSKLNAAHAEVSKRHGIAGVVVQSQKRELRVSYWSHEIGARSLIDELKQFDACWAGDSRLGDDDHVVRAYRALRNRYLISVPPTAAIFTIAFIVPNVFPDSPLVGPLESEVCCAGALSWKTLLLLLLSAPVQFGVGYPLHRSAMRAVSSGHLSMDVLVSLGTTLAYMYSLVVTVVWMIIGLEMPEALVGTGHHDGHHGGSIAPPPHFFEASAMLLSILMLGKCIESYAKRKTGDSLRELASHWPSEARLAGTSGDSTSVPCDLLQIDDLVAVTVGETLPCDGLVTTGDMHVDESILTGEDKPVRKRLGDLLVGGSKCLDGHAEFRATAIGANTAMSQIAKMVEAAQSTKPDIQRVASKVSAIFVPSILGLSLLTFAIWSLLVATEAVDVPTSLGAPQSEARMAEESFFISRFALALMMMACPCAFGLAAPTAILVATGSAARKGCLIKSGQAIEVAQQLKAIVLDKTGTVTIGAPTVTNVALCHSHPALKDVSESVLKSGVTLDGKQLEWLPGSEGEPATRLPTDEQVSLLWSVVGAIEAPSQHPLGKSIHSHSKSLLQSVPSVEDWESVTGLGVEGRVPNFGWVRMGRLEWALTGKAPKKKCACPQSCQCSKTANCGCECWAEPEDAPNAEENSSLLKKPRPEDSQCCCGSACRCTQQSSCGCSCFTRSNQMTSTDMSSMQQWIENAGAQGAGVVVVTLNNELLGAVVVRDVLQPGAPEAVRALQAKGIDVWLCSGDQKSTTKAVAAELGIKYWMGECMPQDKARHVAELASKCSVGFVGDGVNDAIALGAATLGVAIGAGAHVTVDAADVVLVRSAFEDFLGFVQLSRITLRTIRMNYVWAFAFNIIGLPLAAGVLYPRVHMPPVAAGAAMAGSSLMVVLNSLRLRSTGGLWSRPAVRGKPDAERPRGCCIGRSR